MTLHGNQTDDDLRLGHRAAPFRSRPSGLARAQLATAGLGQRQEGHEGIAGTRPTVVAAEHPDQPLQIAAQRGIERHLQPQVLEYRGARRAGDTPRRGAQQRLVDPAHLRIAGHRNRLQHGLDLGKAGAVQRQPVAPDQALLDDDGGQRRQTPGVAAGLELDVDIGERGGLALARIDHDQRARRVLVDLVQHHAGAREAMRLPRVLADEHRHFAVLEVAVVAAAEHLALHPEFAGLFLRQRVGAVLHAERLQRGVAIGTTEVIALTTATVIEDGLAAPARLDRLQALRDFADGDIPADRLIAAVGLAAHRRGDPVGAILVVIHALRLLAHVAAP